MAVALFAAVLMIGVGLLALAKAAAEPAFLGAGMLDMLRTVELRTIWPAALMGAGGLLGAYAAVRLLIDLIFGEYLSMREELRDALQAVKDGREEAGR